MITVHDMENLLTLLNNLDEVTPYCGRQGVVAYEALESEIERLMGELDSARNI